MHGKMFLGGPPSTFVEGGYNACKSCYRESTLICFLGKKLNNGGEGGKNRWEGLIDNPKNHLRMQ